MKPISFTSGQLLDIIAILEEKENDLFDNGDKALSIYYMQMGMQFQRMYDRLQSLPGEHRVAELVMPTSENTSN